MKGIVVEVVVDGATSIGCIVGTGEERWWLYW